MFVFGTMNKNLLLLLLLLATACTTPPHFAGNSDSQQWQKATDQPTTLLKEKKLQEVVVGCKLTISELLELTDAAEPSDTLIRYTRKILQVSYQGYLVSKQFQPGIEYMDSLNHTVIVAYHFHCLLYSKEKGKPINH